MNSLDDAATEIPEQSQNSCILFHSRAGFHIILTSSSGAERPPHKNIPFAKPGHYIPVVFPSQGSDNLTAEWQYTVQETKRAPNQLFF